MENIPMPMNMSAPDISSEWRRFKDDFDLALSGRDLDETANDKRKCDLFFKYIGEGPSSLAKKFDKDQLKTFEALSEAFSAIFTNMARSRFIFRGRAMTVGERFNEFYNDLRRLARDCAFENEDDQIRDAIMIGHLDETVREDLRDEKPATLEEAVKLCRGYEANREDLRRLAEMLPWTDDFLEEHELFEVTDDEDQRSEVSPKLQTIFACIEQMKQMTEYRLPWFEPMHCNIHIIAPKIDSGQTFRFAAKYK
jgi:hypothetical protein